MVSDERDEMHDDVHDEMIERVAASLRPLPEIDPAARARLLVAVAAERERDRERQRRASARRPRVLWWSAAAVALAAAAVVVTVMLPPGQETSRGAPDMAAATPSPSAPEAPAALAGRDAGAVTLRAVQLVFRAPTARRVNVVGDFSGWDPNSAAMTRDSGSGLWTVTLRLTPGRHVYAFIVDDSIWVSDPRAPSAPDADFGRPGSVLLVGQP